MHSDIIHIDNEKSWPSDVREYLDKNYSVLGSWEKTVTYRESRSKARACDNLIYGLSEILQNYFLHGYHCTRLTEKEMEAIRSSGMSLPDIETLKRRINVLKEDDVISSEIAERLLNENQAADKNRANMIWFCFFKPHIAGQGGLERLFRSWGGEALYNSHEQDPFTGPILKQIGIPSIVEAKVSIKGLYIDGFSSLLAKQYRINQSITEKEQINYEWNSKLPIGPKHILNIFKFPGKEFIDLTKYNNWDPPL